MLPTYTRVNNSPSLMIFSRKSFRSREKFLILLVLLTFGFVCCCAFFLLPDNFGSEHVIKVYKQFKKTGPEIFIPAPPAAHGINNEEDIHKTVDRAKLAEKIKIELGEMDILEKPETNRRDSSSLNNNNEELPLVKPPVRETNKKIESVNTDFLQLNIVNDEDSDPVARERRNKVKEVRIKN